MFTGYIKEKVHDEVRRIEDRKPIGEFYGKYYGCYGTDCGYQWQDFTVLDIKDSVDDKTKIGRQWIDKQNIIFYKDIYKSQKEVIEKRISKLTKRG